MISNSALSLHSPCLYLVLDTIYTETSGNRDFIRSRSKAWANQIGVVVRKFPQLFIDECDFIANIDLEIDFALQKHLLFVVTEETIHFVDLFLETCGVEFIGDVLENGDISLTSLGVSYITQIHNEMFWERARQLPPKDSSATSEKLSFYSFARKYQKSLEKSHLWKDQTEFIISRTETGLQAGLDDNSEYCTQCGDVFTVNSWATQWWDIYYGGIAVPIQLR